MRDHLPKIIIVSLLVIIVGLPVVLRPSGEDESLASAGDGDVAKLIIFTPHNEQIRFEVAQAYNQWRVDRGEVPVKFEWRSPGGTSDIRRGILDQYRSLYNRGKPLDDGIGADLFFGGGDYDHGKVSSGITVDDVTLRIIDDPKIDRDAFDAAFPNERIGGERLYRYYTFTEDGEEVKVLGWTGVTLSSFGVVFNRDVLAKINADEPTTWSDLASPQYRGWVALADPGHSGSITATFNTILRRAGWGEGWGILRRTYANARYFTTSASTVPNDVARGDAAAGMCIDFYGRSQAGLIGGDRLGYADPVEDGKSMTATTADPITLLRGAPSADLAREFIAWLLTPDAQGLWQRSIAGSGGDADAVVRPVEYELRRQPIRSDMYTDAERAGWTDGELDPFATAVPFPEGTPNYFGMVAPLTQAMAIDIHGELVAAWEAINRVRDPEHPQHAMLDEMVALFDAMPEELTLTWPDEDLAANWRAIHHDPGHARHAEVVAVLDAFDQQLDTLGDRHAMEASRIRWRGFFQDNYRAILRLERGG